MRLIAIPLTFLAFAIFSAAANAEANSNRSPELQVLDRFAGTWDIEVTVKPAGQQKSTFNAISTRTWSQRGTFIHFDDPNRPGEPEFQMLLTYDPDARNYPGVMMSGPSRSEITGTWDEKAQAMNFTAELADGNKMKSTHRFIDKDHANPSGVITNPAGEVVLELSWKQTRRKAAGGKQTGKTAKPTVDKVVANYLEAIGGLEANKKHTTRKMEGTFTLAEVDTPWKLTVTMKAPNLRHTSVEIPGAGVFTEGYDGKVAWKSEPGNGTSQFSGEELKQKQRDASFYGLIDLRSQYKTLTYDGQETVKGKFYDLLKCTYEDGREETLYIDTNSHFPGLWKRPDVTIAMSDYRKVDGIPVSFAMAVSLPGQSETILTMKVEKMTHGVKVDDALFAMPKD